MLNYSRIQGLANKLTLEAKDTYRGHREQTMQRIRESLRLLGKRADRILIAGVGNANDLDLEELIGLAEEVWLVDIDEATIQRIAARFTLTGKVRIWCGDAGGMSSWIDTFREKVYAAPEHLSSALCELSALQALPGPVSQFPFPGTFDLAVSQCVLSQILWPVTQTIWDIAGISWFDGQRKLKEAVRVYPYVELARVLRQLAFSHLAWLLEVVHPGGVAILNSDVVWQGTPIYGTDIMSLMETIPRTDLPQWIREIILDEAMYWDWKIDESTEARVQSVIFQRK
ncbi:MAG: hypothetical protein ACYCVD_01610 [Desulfitobacteriaceae bacterium]